MLKGSKKNVFLCRFPSILLGKTSLFKTLLYYNKIQDN